MESLRAIYYFLNSLSPFYFRLMPLPVQLPQIIFVFSGYLIQRVSYHFKAAQAKTDSEAVNMFMDFFFPLKHVFP